MNLELAVHFCEYATEMLKAAGFKHVYTSMRSEACYYEHPAKKGLIRIATHKFGRSQGRMVPRNHGKVLSCITFNPENLGKSKSFEWVDMRVQQAVGKYFLTLDEQHEYSGKSSD